MIIALGHRSGHGKDTFAEILKSKLPNVYIRSWADAVKEECVRLYGHLGVQDRDFYNTREGRTARNIPIPKLGKTVVEVWIHVGEKLRELYWDTWLDQLHLYYASLPSDSILVVPDTRHINEADSADFTVKIVNPRVPNRVGASIDHVLDDYQFHCTITNDGTLEDFAKTAESFIRELRLESYTDRSHFSLLNRKNSRRLGFKVQ